ALGDERIGRGRRDLQDIVGLVDLRRRHGDARIEMPDHELHAGGDEIVGDRLAPAQVAEVIADARAELLAENAASLVDVGDCLLGALLQLRAEGGTRPGHWHADTDADGFPGLWAGHRGCLRRRADLWWRRARWRCRAPRSVPPGEHRGASRSERGPTC